MRTKIQCIFFLFLFLLFSANPVIAAEYGSLKNTVVLPGTVNEVSGIVGHYIAGQVQQGDTLTFRLPMGSFWTKANIDSDESTALSSLQTSAEWGTPTLQDSFNMRYGTDYNYILIPATYAGNANGLFNGAAPTLEVTSFSKGELYIQITGMPNASQECYLLLYSNRVYIADGITGDISVDIDSPSNKALNASIPGGSIPTTVKTEAKNETPKEPEKSNLSEKAVVDSSGNEPSEIKVEFQIGQKQIKINGNKNEIPAAPYISQSRAYVPLRFLAEALGIKPADITWQADLKQMNLKQGSDLVGINLENNTITINGLPAYVLDAPIEIVNPGYTMVPVRYVGQVLGASVSWNAMDNSIIISK